MNDGEIDEAVTLLGSCIIIDLARMQDAAREVISALADFLPAARLTLDRRRYNRARRKAVRAVLSGLGARGPSRRARGAS